MENYKVKSKQCSVPVQVKRKLQQTMANNQNFLTSTLEVIAVILKDIKDANQQIRTFKGVFQNNPDYIQIADTLFTNLSLLGKLSTRKLPELERIKEDGMLDIENAIRNLDLKLQRNYENSFGKYQKQRQSEIILNKKSSKLPLGEVQVHKSSNSTIDKHPRKGEQEKRSQNIKLVENETKKSKRLNKLPWCQNQEQEHSNTEDYFTTDQQINTCLILNSETEPQAIEFENREGNFKKYVESILADDFNDVMKNLSEEEKTLRDIETIENQSKRYKEPIQAASNKIYNDLKYFDKMNKRVEEFVRGHKSVEDEKQTKPEIMRFILDAHDDRLKITEKVSVLLMQLQILFLILIVEIPLLVLFVLALVWRR